MNTTRIFASQAVPGMVVAEDVYTFNNQLIIAAGTTLDDKMITRMKFYSVATIVIKKEEKVDTSNIIIKHLLNYFYYMGLIY